MGLFSGIASIFGGSKQKKASKKAEAAQLEYLNKALDYTKETDARTQEQLSPFVEGGTAALQPILDLLGIGAGGAGAQGAAISGLEESPLFTSLVRNGEEAVLQNGSATGGLRGGNIQGGLANFRADTLTQTIENQLQRLGGLAGMGQSAVNSAGSFGQNTASAVSNIFGQQGQVRAGGLLTRGGITAGQFAAGGGMLDSIASAIGGGGGGGIGATIKGLF